MSARRGNRSRHLFLVATSLLAALPTFGNAQLIGQDLPDLSGVAGAISGTIAPKGTGPVSSGVKVPSLAPGATAKEIGRRFRTNVEAKTGGKNAGLQQLEGIMPKVLAMLEDQLVTQGLAKRDFGVAVAYCFLTNYEVATGKVASPEARLAATRTIAAAAGKAWGTRFRAMAPETQEEIYEKMIVAPMLLEGLQRQFEKVGKTFEAEVIRKEAAGEFQKAFGISPSAVSIDDAGRISGLPAGRAPVATSSSGRVATGAGKAGGSTGVLAPAKLHGAKVYVLYLPPDMFRTGSNFRELVLFPDGSAFEGLPSEPIPSFDPATIRRLSKDYHTGVWRQSGDRLSVTIDGGKPETYVRHPSGGWAVSDYKSGVHNVFWPAKPATKAQLLGAWTSKSLSAAGSLGGGAPMVAAGSTGALSFAPDGTFSRTSEGFASATNANMGDASKGGNVTVSGRKNSGTRGRWRLDGPVLTMLENGRQSVQLAYVLPNWSKANAPELLIAGDLWSRPKPRSE